jgi:superfamily I DNA and/or RNA helicase/very-short-patch-repair endonuclease
MNPVENKKIEYWKSQLLDTGKRNKMINYRETARATLKIVEPGLDELYANYVQNENELTFEYPLDKDSDIRTYSVLRLFDRLSCPIPVLLGDIKVATSFQESKKTLKNLRNKSKLALEEQGTNILYLSLGFIEWQENHGSHHSWVKSPLILVPVSLTVETLNAPFKLVRYDDDVVVNPTLQHLLSADYGIELPSFDPDKDTVEDYLKTLEDIADEKGWRIIREASIGLLSFLKINMYKDLENNIENISNNAVLKAMLGDTSEIVNIPEELKSYNHDTLIPKECFQVLSADSSQQDAIELSKRGVSFVMQGPPGTGKSQTITNIIAEALAADKKVLFVSEKMAALQVVYKRLSELGLAEFCLALHSHKANKKQVLDDIQNTLSLKKTRVKQEAIEELDRLNFERTELNQYATELHEEIAPLNISCYDVYGILDNLKSATDALFSVEDVDKITRETLNEMIYNLENLANYINNSNFDLENNPWFGVAINSLSLEDKQQIDINIKTMVKYIEELVAKSTLFATDYKTRIIDSLPEFDNSFIKLDKILEIPLIPVAIYDASDIESLQEYTEKISSDFGKYVKNKETIYSWFAPSIYQIDVDILNSSIMSKIEELKGNLSIQQSNVHIIKNIEEHELCVKKEQDKIKHIIEIMSDDVSLLCLGMDISIKNAQILYNLINELKKRPQCQIQWFEIRVLHEALSSLSKYKALCESIKAIKEKIEGHWSNDVLQIDYAEISNGFNADCQNLFCKFNLDTDFEKEKVLEYSRKQNELKLLDGNKENTLSVLTSLSRLITTVEEIIKILSLNVVITPQTISKIYEIINVIKNKPLFQSSWFDNDVITHALQNIDKYKSISNKINAVINNISEKWEKEVINIDSDSILNRFKTDYRGIFKIFKSQYRTDKKQIVQYFRNPLEKIQDQQIVELLLQLKDLHELRYELEKENANINLWYGSFYNGENTDWDNLSSALLLAQQLLKTYPNIKEQTEFIKILVNGQYNDFEKVLSIYDALSPIKVQTSYDEYAELFSDNFNYDEDLCTLIEKIKVTHSADCQIVELLSDLKKLSEKETELKQNMQHLCQLYGDAYVGENTDWDSIHDNLTILQNIFNICPNVKENKKIQEIVTNNRYDSIKKIFDTVSDLSPESIQNLSVIYNKTFVNPLSFSNELSATIETINCIIKTINEIAEYKKQLNSLCAQGEIYDDIFSKLGFIVQTQDSEKALHENDELCRMYYGELYEFEATDWNAIKQHVQNKKIYSELIKSIEISGDIARNIAINSKFNGAFSMRINELKEISSNIKEGMPFIIHIFGENYGALPLKELSEKLRKCSGKVELLEKYLDYKTFRDKCIACGLKELVLAIEKDGIKDIVDCFKKRFYMLWLSKVLETKPSIANFKRVMHDKTVNDFCTLDEHQLSIARMRIREKLINSLPSKDRLLSAHDEMSILTRELGKKRRIMPIRKLFRTIPNLLLKIKPCFMMSPLSVSYFLEAQTYNFDMVIFDEASQIFPEDAIGAILRSKQVIIAGDTKQLPPTNFFASSANNLDGQFDAADDEGEDEIFDSILEETASILPNRTLLWHYRSRHEDLIAFSNSHIYKNELITFPGSAISKTDTGVEYYKVSDGVYEDRCNVPEAKKCVELIIDHINNHPDLSLGIIAFSEKQQSTIEQVLYEYREQHPKYEWFFDENKDEPFFIKNLENVQGDERDTIIFSICYAKNSRGTMLMNFGPLGKQGGERRLNVAVTRAKTNIKLVGSIEPTDIDLDRAKSDGARLLRSYIEFAIKGSSTLPNQQMESLDNRDDFCDCIYDFLLSKGYKVSRNIGCSDYKIDLAVEHPNKTGTYIAGIECDGESYSTARTARERDHLRPQILKNMGWSMYRVWSTAWIKNPTDEQDKLIAFINECMKSNPQEMTIAIDETYDVPVETVVEEKHNTTVDNDTTNPYGFDYYVVANWYDAPQNYNAGNEQRIADVINYILSVEQPMHMDLLYQRIAGLFDREKATSVVRDNVDYVIKRHMKTAVVIKDNFISRTDMPEIKVRVSEIITEEARKVEHIAIPEIEKAMMTIADYALGINEADLKVETARIFGFERMGPKVSKAMNDAFISLLKSGKIKLIDEKVHIMEEV